MGCGAHTIPSCTTFLLAAEVFPISVRATAHGLSAASGKLGALMPAIIYNYVPSRTRFWIVCWFGFAGWLVTWVFIPDTTGLDLREQERYWDCVREGRAGDYHGFAVHPRHISVWERYILKRHRAYDPELDRQQRANELRTLWEQQKLLVKEGGRTEDELDYEDETVLSSKASSFFASEWQLPMVVARQVVVDLGRSTSGSRGVTCQPAFLVRGRRLPMSMSTNLSIALSLISSSFCDILVPQL
jgi:hypothetical protein